MFSKLVFFNEKKMGKIPTKFDIENFGTFWHLPISTILKIQQFPLSLLILRQKSLFHFGDPKQSTAVKIIKIQRFQNSDVPGHFSVSNMSWILLKRVSLDDNRPGTDLSQLWILNFIFKKCTPISWLCWSILLKGRQEIEIHILSVVKVKNRSPKWNSNI